MGDNAALISFHRGWDTDGVDPDTGMPRYKPVVKITKAIPPTTEFTGLANEYDFANPDYREAYEVFQNEEKGRTISPDEGYPLVMWPALDPLEVKMCLQHGIYTVEQLAKLPATRSPAIPPSIMEVAKRAAKMVELMKTKGKYEVLITELEGQIAAVREDNNQMRATIQAQNQQLDMLRMRVLQVA
jgi:hypothetical protein